ncbi:hypothetical protein L2E82_19619 [Cichorium intybus]|uniref:Uncharacterized protein n=1 Tax=Cichorium intybus TaxID=13427 RepID=A0ACB9FD44_CICIN|nr:hypothetical protein L2E82_19619 [Cichorium intybus]
MATHERQPHQIQVHTVHHPPGYGGESSLHHQQGPSKSKILAVMALLPVGGALLGLAGLTFVGTMIGLAVATPVFIIFSPVIVPAALTIGLAVTGFLTSGTFGLTGLTSLSFLVNRLRQATGSVPEQIDYAKERMQDLAVYAGQKTEEVGQTIQSKAQEIGTEDQSQAQTKSGRRSGKS